MKEITKLLLEDPLGLAVTLLRVICLLGFPIAVLMMVITTNTFWAIFGLSSIVGYLLFSFIMFELMKRARTQWDA